MSRHFFRFCSVATPDEWTATPVDLPILILLAMVPVGVWVGGGGKPKPQISKSVVSVQPAVGAELIEPLSERETEVLQLIAEGLTNPEIGDRLYISLNTVKVHTRNIYGKLDVHSRSQAVAKARRLGVLPH